MLNIIQKFALRSAESLIDINDRLIEGRHLSPKDLILTIALYLSWVAKLLIEKSRISDVNIQSKFTSRMALYQLMRQRICESRFLYESVYQSKGLSNRSAIIARLNLINVYRTEGDAPNVTQMFDEIIKLLLTSQDIDPEFKIDCFKSAALYYMEQGEFDKALSQIQQAYDVLSQLGLNAQQFWKTPIKNLLERIQIANGILNAE